jgi:hypothetical protein
MFPHNLKKERNIHPFKNSFIVYPWPGATAFSITTLSIMGSFETLSINDTGHK